MTLSASRLTQSARINGRWTIDPTQSVARFSMNYLVVATLKGTLGSVRGTLILDEDEPANSAVTASIDVASIRTGIGLRDRHLRSSDFFHAEKFPQMTFQSTAVERAAGGGLRVVGDLTIRGVTNQVTLATTCEELPDAPDGARGARFVGATVLSRRAFGLGTRAIETARLVASDRVDVTLDISAVSA